MITDVHMYVCECHAQPDNSDPQGLLLVSEANHASKIQ
jgi:hypothetical protein